MSTIKSSYIFLKDTQGITDGCRVNISEISNGKTTIFSVTHSDNSNDYYFPYIQAYAGHVNVENPQDGTIVLTPPMNGCALEVRYFHGYTFYHDANGKNMDKVQSKGVLCCRIEAEAYWSDNYAKKPKIALPAVQFVCVYSKQKWYVGAFGVQIRPTGNQELEVYDVFEPIGGRFRGYFSCTQYLTTE